MFIYKKSKITFSSFTKYFKGRAHVEAAVKCSDASKYCKKDDTRQAGPWEYGQEPQWNEDRKDLWEAARAAAVQRKFESIPAAMYVRYIKNFHMIADEA